MIFPKILNYLIGIYLIIIGVLAIIQALWPKVSLAGANKPTGSRGGRQILDYANNNILFNRRFQMKRKSILSLALSIIMILAITLVSACTSAPTQPTGTVEIRATDAPPAGVSKIMVTTKNIQIHKADAPEDSWITVVSQEKTFDLVAIQGAEVFLGLGSVVRNTAVSSNK